MNFIMIEDHNLVRQGVSKIIEEKSDFRCTGAFSTVNEAKSFLADYCKTDYQPLLCIVDINLGDEDGLSLIRFIKDNYQKIADLWDRDVKALGNDITAKMPEGEKKTFFDGENTFLVSRNHECMKAVGQNKVSIQERIDYLDRYIVMTREHCKDLVKEYTSYLAT